MVKMEKFLNIFVADNTQCRIPMTMHIIREKALHLYECLKPNFKAEDVELFNTIKGWFKNV